MASREYELTGNRRAYRKALRRQADSHFQDGGTVVDFVDLVSSGGNSELIRQLQEGTGYSRGKAAALLRAAQRRYAPDIIEGIYDSPEYQAAQQRVREGQQGGVRL
jgi:hypothetical protein